MIEVLWEEALRAVICEFLWNGEAAVCGIPRGSVVGLVPVS